jgi:hypothetical protein
LRVGTEWEKASGSGGGGWFEPPFKRPNTIGPRDAQTHGEVQSGGDGWDCCAVDGLAGIDAAFVEVEDGDGATRRPIESPFGAFVACSDASQVAIVRVLSASGEILLERRFGGARPRGRRT